MPNTYTQITIHLIFAVKNRENLLKKSIRPELFKYMSGIVKNKNHKLLAINGVADHVHLLIGQSPTMALSDLVRDIKNNSSKFINQKKLVLGKFGWQTGYGAFSYSRSQRPNVIKYIENQEEHHKVKTFREEYLEILQKFDVEYDSEYIFEFYE
ncbi:MAG: IS200/IS605 family transposase [Melioribacteraceae bacterium]|nr:IS200/IS605 family transposase [Melioribacteraceae bacterium]